MSRFTLISPDVETTLMIGEEVGRLLPGGSFVALTGELGAGKSQLAKGIAQGLGVAGWAALRSPTFTLMLTYHGGRCVMHHVDFYRLAEAPELPGEIEEAMNSPTDVCVVEWAQVWRELWPRRFVHIELEGLEDNRRRVTIHDDFDMLPGLQKAVSRWAETESG